MSEPTATTAPAPPASQKIPPRIPFRQQMHRSRLSSISLRLGRWLARGEPLEDHKGATVGTHPWRKVIWLTGVDYFSTLGYQPGIALLAAGAVAPIATVILVLVTLLGALPVYAQVAGRSFAGQGSIALLENLLTGWKGKSLVLILLGFAATDFVITMTLSAADAAKHAIENPYLHTALGEHQILVTLVILLVLAARLSEGILRGDRPRGCRSRALSAVERDRARARHLRDRHAPHAAAPTGARRSTLKATRRCSSRAPCSCFPKLALGLSGFETGVSVMPLISGGDAGRGLQPANRQQPERPHREYAQAAPHGGRNHERDAHRVEHGDDAADPARGLSGRRQGGGTRHRVPRASVSRVDVRDGLRPLDDLHPRPRRRIGHGRIAPPDTALPASLRDGAALGDALAPADPGAALRQHRHHARSSARTSRRRAAHTPLACWS